MEPISSGQAFREEWIKGVNRYYPGQPKDSYIAPWDQTAEWERDSAAAVYDQVRAFIETANGGATNLTRVQKGRFVAVCWTGQIWKHFPDPKPSYVADWDELPEWQQQTDSDIFEQIEQRVQAVYER